VRADVSALWAYYTAVIDRTRALVVAGLPDAVLDPPVEPDRLRRVLFDEVMLRPAHPWDRGASPFSGRSRASLLTLFGMTPNYGHWHDISTVRGLLAG
jgi:hypothetical protein